MRPGLIFLLLFAVLIAVYAVFADALGTVPTFLLQAVIIAIALGAALWLRRRITRARGQDKGEVDEAAPEESLEEPPSGPDDGASDERP